MNPLAEELNLALEGTTAGRCLSEYGKAIYFPKGIVAQSAEASKLAKTYNATAGMAFKDGDPLILPTIQENLPRLTPSEAVGYAPTAGEPRLRNLWKEEMIRKNPGLQGENVGIPSVVTGITGGLVLAAELFCQEGDNVFFPDLSWDNYELIFNTKCKANIITYPLFTSEGGLNMAALADLIIKNTPTEGKAILVLNFPHNPSGYSPTVDEAVKLNQELRRVAESGRDLVVILDDAYFGLFYENDVYRQSLFTTLHNTHERLLAVKCDGATKEDYVWGFRIGFFTLGSRSLTPKVAEAMEAKIKGAIRASISSASRVAQSILYKELTSLVYHGIKVKFAEALGERYYKVKSILQHKTTGRELKAMPFNSGYFMSFHTGNLDAEKLRRTLLDKEGVGTIALDSHHLRVCFAAVDLQDIVPLYEIIFRVADQLSENHA